MTLSARQRQVLRLVAEGCTDAEIGERLGIARDTARVHVEAVRNRLHARTRAHAVAIQDDREPGWRGVRA